MQHHLATKAAKSVSKVDKVTKLLQPMHLQSLHCVLYYGLSHLFDHWVKHCYPSDALASAREVDAAVTRTLG
eukprot:4715578-Karenia_brevis.AAC.1